MFRFKILFSKFYLINYNASLDLQGKLKILNILSKTIHKLLSIDSSFKAMNWNHQIIVLHNKQEIHFCLKKQVLELSKKIQFLLKDEHDD